MNKKYRLFIIAGALASSAAFADKGDHVRLEPLVDIHASAVVLAHPSTWVSSEQATEQLRRLKAQDEARNGERASNLFAGD